MNRTDKLQNLDGLHHLHPFSNNAELAQKGVRIIERADGIYLFDSEGNKIIDGMSGLWCVNLGYGRAELVEVAREQMQKLTYYNSFFQCTTPPAIELSKILSEVTPPQFNNVFFTNSGSEANDTMLRMVRHYWALKGKSSKKIVIARNNAYHGSTVAGASLGGMAPMHQQGGLPIPDIVHIPQPYWFGEGMQEREQDFGVRIAQTLEQAIEQHGIDNIAAFIAEPIQGAGGMIIPPSSYWPEVQRICKAYEILLVADEVICGFGRTGKWFGSDYYQIQPDLMPIAKGLSSGYLPIGGVMVSDTVAEVLRSTDFNHGFTYSGHPVAAVVATENIRILRDEGIVDRVDSEIGPYFQQKMQSLASHPLVGQVRGVGLLGCVELVANKENNTFFEDKNVAGTTCRDQCIANGLVMRHVNSTMMLAPPLIITAQQIDEMVHKAQLSLDATAKILL